MKLSINVKTTIKSLIYLTLLATSQLQAALVDFSVDGEITSAEIGNTFGLSIGDLITASGQFDDSVIGAGITEVDFTTAVNNMQISVGNALYTDATESFGGALIFFNNGVFDGIDYDSVDGTFDSWGSLGELDTYGNVLDDFNGLYDGSHYKIGGSWLASTFEVTPVPVPAAVWLFGSGIVFLAGFARRKTNLLTNVRVK